MEAIRSESLRCQREAEHAGESVRLSWSHFRHLHIPAKPPWAACQPLSLGRVGSLRCSSQPEGRILLRGIFPPAFPRQFTHHHPVLHLLALSKTLSGNTQLEKQERGPSTLRGKVAHCPRSACILLLSQNREETHPEDEERKIHVLGTLGRASTAVRSQPAMAGASLGQTEPNLCAVGGLSTRPCVCAHPRAGMLQRATCPEQQPGTEITAAVAHPCRAGGSAGAVSVGVGADG